MKFISEIIGLLPEYQRLNSSLKNYINPIALSGLSTIHKSQIIHTLCLNNNKSALILVSDELEAQTIVSDLNAMGTKALFYPLKDFIFHDVHGHSREYSNKRIEALCQKLYGKVEVIVACIDAASQFTIPPKILKDSNILIKVGEKLDIEKLEQILLMNGYEKTIKVEGPGQYSRRGYIFDIFSINEKSPIRIEFWDDEIDSLNYFEIESQRRTDYVEEFFITPASESLIIDKEDLIKKIQKKANSVRGQLADKIKEKLQNDILKLENQNTIQNIDKYFTLLYDKEASLFDYFNKNDLVFISENSRVKERMKGYSWQFNEDLKGYFSDGILCKGLDRFYVSYDEIIEEIKNNKLIYLDNFTHGNFDLPLGDLITFYTKQLSKWSGSLKVLSDDLSSYKNENKTVVILAGTEKSAMTLTNDLVELGFKAVYSSNPENLQKNIIYVTAKTLSSGFEYPSLNFMLVTHGQILESKTKRKKTPKNGKEIYNLSELSIGDYVVHVNNGVGIYQGIHALKIQGIVKDYIKIQYAKGDVLYVPVTQLDMVAKYIGPKENSKVKINTLGGSEWAKAKARVKTAAKDMAKELIKLYADRMNTKGFAFSSDGEWQRDFEYKFPYEETEDQKKCIDEIKYDMQREAPMDRLLCGDVGFGKTEVALRAAFKCVTDSKQCALLAPTTILAWQHYQTVLKRFDGFPVNVELLSRFRTKKKQDKIINELKTGEVDMIIGTHRLIQNDVKFKDLGLVIIDEEQRFGVAQKEKLKESCKNTDILTLSATPIPRTLNMAMSGIRDMSIIEEAPQDRWPIQTYVLEYDNALILEAIRKELRRGGQVFYLYNKVGDIDLKAARIQNMIPEAKVDIGHGKMTENQLSEVWRKMLEQEINVLVCTTIIETGIDLPNANTLIIENADCFGLSQLHQLRGRVGRSTRRAYAYLTFEKNKAISEIAEKRLSALREFTEFGSGFKIAMRDLELRGAGNLLGANQHGHMEDVGYDMYIKILEQAINEEKGISTNDTECECLVDLQIQAHIPESYIEATSDRIDAYKRIAGIRSETDAEDVIDEFIDRFGELPKSVTGLIDIAMIRNLAAKNGIYEIKQMPENIIFYVKDIRGLWVEKIIKQLKGKALLNAGTRPYISIRVPKEQVTLKFLQNILK